MGIKDWIIKKLESDVEPSAGHIDLENLDNNTRNELFKQFGEGDENLTRFLKTAYDNKAPSLFCCSGHGLKSAYVILRVTEENIELLRKMGKVLSKYGVSTNFTDDYIRGIIVDYRSIKSHNTDWLNIASQIMENPELFDDTNPEIYYHQKITTSYKPIGFELKKKILHYLRKDIKQLPERSTFSSKRIPSWILSEEERRTINQQTQDFLHQQTENKIIDNEIGDKSGFEK